MTRDELSEMLDHLDPGATITVSKEVLARLFNEATLSYDSQEALRRITDFALEHRCSFSFHEHEDSVPCFQKDDVF